MVFFHPFRHFPILHGRGCNINNAFSQLDRLSLGEIAFSAPGSSQDKDHLAFHYFTSQLTRIKTDNPRSLGSEGCYRAILPADPFASKVPGENHRQVSWLPADEVGLKTSPFRG